MSNLIVIKAKDNASRYLSGGDEIRIKNGRVFGSSIQYEYENTPVVVVGVEEFFNIDRDINSYSKGIMNTGVNGISSTARYLKYFLSFKGMMGDYSENVRAIRNNIYNFFNSSKSYSFKVYVNEEINSELESVVYIDDFFYNFNSMDIEFNLMFNNQYLSRYVSSRVFNPEKDIYINNSNYTPVGTIFPEVKIDLKNATSAVYFCTSTFKDSTVEEIGRVSFSGIPKVINGSNVSYILINNENRTAFLLNDSDKIIGSAMRYKNSGDWFGINLNFSAVRSLNFSHETKIELKYHSVDVY